MRKTGTTKRPIIATRDSFPEAINWSHNGTNTGDIPVRLIAVHMGGGSEANTAAASAP